MSQAERPKQFLPLACDATMFEATVARCADRERFAAPMIVANARHADLIEAQAKRIDELENLVELQHEAIGYLWDEEGTGKKQDALEAYDKLNQEEA